MILLFLINDSDACGIIRLSLLEEYLQDANDFEKSFGFEEIKLKFKRGFDFIINYLSLNDFEMIGTVFSPVNSLFDSYVGIYY